LFFAFDTSLRTAKLRTALHLLFYLCLHRVLYSVTLNSGAVVSSTKSRCAVAPITISLPKLQTGSCDLLGNRRALQRDSARAKTKKQGASAAN
jgi:hypothetical protein